MRGIMEFLHHPFGTAGVESLGLSAAPVPEPGPAIGSSGIETLLLCTSEDNLNPSRTLAAAVEQLKAEGTLGSCALAQLLTEQLHSRTAGIVWSLLAAREIRPAPALTEALGMVSRVPSLRHGSPGRYPPEIVGSGEIAWTDGTNERIREHALQALAALASREPADTPSPSTPTRAAAEKPEVEPYDLASKVAGGWPAELDRAKFLTVDSEALVARLRKYQQMTHPGGKQRPEYRLVSGQVARVGYPLEDFRIATVASMLAGKARVTPFDDAASTFAYQVIQEYGGWRLAKFLFSIPRSLDIQADGRSGAKTIIVIEDFIVDVYSGTENLLFEIYEELAEGEVMDDARVRRKLVALAFSTAPREAAAKES